MRLPGAVVVLLLAGTAAQAQDNMTTVPVPGIDRYSLPPGNNQATPTPTRTPAAAVPTQSPTPAPPAVVPTVTVQPTPAASSTTAPRPTPTRTAPPVVVVPTPTATADVAPVPDTVATRTPAPTEPTIAPAPAEAKSGTTTWPWWVIGVTLAAVAAIFAWRRFGRSRARPIADPPEASPPIEALAPLPDVPEAVVPPTRAIVFDFRPQRLWTRGPDAHLAFELVVTNTGATLADAVRPVIVLASAGPDTAAEIAAFNANVQTIPGGEPFGLAPGETRTISGELTLSGDAMYVTTAADRELIVPVALVNLQWRAGLSLARANEAFVIGTGDASAARLGPIWVDRAGLVYAKLDARRFTAAPA